MSAQTCSGFDDYSGVTQSIYHTSVNLQESVCHAAVFQYRYDLYQRKPYPTLSASALIRDLETKKNLLASGRVGIYLGVFPTYQNHQWIYSVLDIDGEGKSPVSAIERAQELYAELRRRNLSQHAKWMLSGTGLRCVFPFLIPIELRGGFIRYLERLKDFGVDVGPFCGVDPPPIRLLCYRGHGKQRRLDDKFLDRHSALIDTETLLSIQNEADYDHFTHGRPDPDQYLSWFREILPKTAYLVGDEAAPPEIRAFLDDLADLQIQHEISANIFEDFHFPTIRSKHRLNIGFLFDHLKAIGIEASEREGFFILSICPVCGRRKKAYLLPNGLLRCFRSSCAAFRGNGGLPASEWAGPDFFDYHEDFGANDTQEPEFIDLVEAECLLYERIRNATGDAAFVVTPGCGKTRSAVAKATEEAGSRIVVYAFPNHRLIDEWMETAKSWTKDGVPVIHFYGRRDNPPVITCYHMDKVDEAIKLGYFPGKTVCPFCNDHPHRAKRRSYKSEGCPYYHQLDPLAVGGRKRRRGLVFCTTHQLPYLLSEDFPANRAYIDEQALSAMVQPARAIGFDELQTVVPFFSKEAQTVILRLRWAAETLQRETLQQGKKIGRLYTRQPGGTQWQGKPDLWAIAGISKERARLLLAEQLKFLLESSQMALMYEGINMTALQWLAVAVGEGIAWVHANVTKSTKHLSFMRMFKHHLPERTKLTVLDATSSREELWAIFGREFHLTEIHVRWMGRRVWVRQSMGKLKTSRMLEKDIKRHLSRLVEQLPPEVSRALLITHMPIEEKAIEILKALRPDIVWDSTHYFASRGLNAFQSVQAVLCFGTPVLSPGAAFDLAATLFPDDFQQQVQWVQHQNESELYQCAHRARFVRNPGRTLIVMGHYWPEHLLGKPDLVVDKRQNQHSENPKRALERALLAYDALGFFTKEVAAWVGIGMKRDEEKVRQTREALKTFIAEIQDFQLAGDEGSCGSGGYPSFIYNIYIKLGTPEWDQLLLSSHHQFWSKLLAEMERQRPGAGRLSVRLPCWGNRNFTHALGTIEAVRFWTQAFTEFVRPLGYEIPAFNEKAWKEGW